MGNKQNADKAIDKIRKKHKLKNPETEEMSSKDISMKTKYGNTHLHLELLRKSSNYNTIKQLVLAGININAKNSAGITALHYACDLPNDSSLYDNRLDVINLLLFHGANVYARTTLGTTSLHVACSRKDSLDIVKALVSANAGIHVRNSRRSSALHIASKHGNADVVDFLLSINSVVDLKNESGNTPLWLASSYNHKDVIEVLLSYDANINATNGDYLSPIESETINDDTTEYLLSCGAAPRGTSQTVFLWLNRAHPIQLAVKELNTYLPNVLDNQENVVKLCCEFLIR